jgi:hypothetical protein
MSEKKKTLENDEIITERVIGRRSTLGAIGATVLGAAALTAVGASVGRSSAKAQSDSDPNDAAGHGRTGRTDSDSGPNADRAGHGSGHDGGGHGRHCSDSDPRDGVNHGRHCSDSD